MINKIKKMIGLVSEKKPQREGGFDEMTAVSYTHLTLPTILLV